MSIIAHNKTYFENYSESINSTLMRIFLYFLSDVTLVKNLQISPLSEPSIECSLTLHLRFSGLDISCELGMYSSESESTTWKGNGFAILDVVAHYR